MWRDKWRVSGGYLESGVPETFLSLSPSFLSLPAFLLPFSLSPSFACSFSRSILLISWLKMSDTHVPIDQSCVHPHRIVMPRFLLGKSRYAKKKKKKKEERVERDGRCERWRQISSLVDRVSKETGSRSNVEIWWSAYKVYVSFQLE